MPQKPLTIKEFEKRATIVHGKQYDYSKVKYTWVNTHKYVTILCPKHGSFEQTPKNHVHSKQGCPKCSNERNGAKMRASTESYLAKAIAIHSTRYDYSLVRYTDSKSKIQIICKEHGVFTQQANSHLRGSNCPKCKKFSIGTVNVVTKDEFIDRASKFHHNKYDYSLIKYVKLSVPLDIICPIHGIFQQSGKRHLFYGCNACSSSLGELAIGRWLKNEEIEFEIEQKFDTCRNTKLNCMLSFDFYVQSANTLIEFQGGQHYKSIKHFGGDKAFKRLKKNDSIKRRWCKKNGYTLITIKYTKIDQIPAILKKALGTIK